MVENQRALFERAIPPDITFLVQGELENMCATVPYAEVRDILRQRYATSPCMKGVLAYTLHEELGGNLEAKSKARMAAGIELWSSSLVLLDNITDGHTERGGKTTYLSEYGIPLHAAASQLAAHAGIKMFMPYLLDNSAIRYAYTYDTVLNGMIGMDLRQTASVREQQRIIEMTSGEFVRAPLAIAAATATTDKSIIANAGEFGFHLGTGYGIRDELTDLLGAHGRRRATEIESGRIILPLHFAQEQDPSFNVQEYVGNELSDQDYITLLGKLVDTGAITQSIMLMDKYFANAKSALYQLPSRESDRLTTLFESAEIQVQDLLDRFNKSHK